MRDFTVSDMVDATAWYVDVADRRKLAESFMLMKFHGFITGDLLDDYFAECHQRGLFNDRRA
jgi:hypothetical protein